MLGVTMVFCNVATCNATAMATNVATEESVEEKTLEVEEQNVKNQSELSERQSETEKEVVKSDDVALKDDKDYLSKEDEGKEKSKDEEISENIDCKENQDIEETSEEFLEDEIEKKKLEEEEDSEDKKENYKNNIGELSYAGEGSWEVTEDGLLSDAIGKGDCFAFSKTRGTNFVYSTDVTFLENQGAAALLFRSNGTADNKESYVVNIDASNHKCKFFRWQKNDALQLIDEKSVSANDEEKYTLKVVAIDSWIMYYVNDELVASLGDYYLQSGDLGQNTFIDEGVFGLLNWNSKVIYQNTYYREINGNFNPLLNNIKVTSEKGTVGKTARFESKEPMMLQYVDNDASEVNIEVKKKSDDAKIEIRDDKGNLYEDGRNIPVSEGINYIIVKSTVIDEDGFEASAVYRVNVHRMKPEVEYYNEVYRDQYHYSVKEGWGNDPNGLVYYNGKYHFFYQFFDDIKWGPMHWAHATSTDLIHWEDQPIAFYPDANGAMFSGCIVADTDNTSGLFDSDKGGLVAIITADGNGQRMKIAYSSDEGRTWKKLDKVVADWTNDPLRNRDFRDPKVFRWENKWFMVVAGGPLRIYSSDNLLEWRCESTYPDLHTECPDLYPVKTSEGQVKWVLSRGGRFYKVGDFVKVDDAWCFAPDEAYKDKDGIMNFGRDSYAAMTYYVQDFGTADNPDIPQIVEANWMNTWDDYCNSVAAKTGQDFNGTYNLNLTLGLEKVGSTYKLTQEPIKEYKTLRSKSEAEHFKNVTITESENVLEDFKGDTYEITAKFKPDKNVKKVGFKLRKSGSEETIVAYDIENQKLYIDRSNSGIILSGKFGEICAQDMERNEDGSITLHIYVDKASVEVFADNYTVCGAAQIFPSPFSQGLEAFVEGGKAKADINIYPISSIWLDKQTTEDAYAINSMFPKKTMMNCGEEAKIDAYILPVTAEQSIDWSIKSGEDVIELSSNGNVKALKKGTAVVVAKSKANPDLNREFAFEVFENNFKTNIREFSNLSGNWAVDDETLSVSNVCQNDYYMAKEMIKGDYTMKTKIKFKRGLINIFLVSEHMNPLDGDGAYTIQFAPDNKAIRLFPFGRDDIYRGELKEPIGDGKYHSIEVQKADSTLKVFVDGVNSLEYTFENDAKLKEGHVGLGLWDGELDVQTFYVEYEGAQKIEPENQKNDESKTDESLESSKDNQNSDVSRSEVPTNGGKSTNNNSNSVGQSKGNQPAEGSTDKTLSSSTRIADTPVALAAPSKNNKDVANDKKTINNRNGLSNSIVNGKQETEESTVNEESVVEKIIDEETPTAVTEVQPSVNASNESIATESGNISILKALFYGLLVVVVGATATFIFRKKGKR